jgi:hypothetical protein
MHAVVCGHACTCCNCCNLRPSRVVLALDTMLVLQNRTVVDLQLQEAPKLRKTFGSGLTECKS